MGLLGMGSKRPGNSYHPNPLLFNFVLKTHGLLAVCSRPTFWVSSTTKFLHNYVFMIFATKHFYQSYSATSSLPFPVASASFYPRLEFLPDHFHALLLILVKEPPPLLFYLERKILGALFTYIFQHFFVFQTINMKVLWVILSENALLLVDLSS